jgi:hypothetical protein
MPDLKFQIEDAVVVRFAAVPSLAFKLRIANQPAEETIHTIALRCQIQIEATRRRYTPEEQKRLLDLFGEPERWGQTLRSLLWTHANTVVTGFQGSTVVDLPVPCTFDFNVAATKYFEGLGEGAVPLSLMFSGTVFYASSSAPQSVPQGGNLQVAPISWQAECRYTLPVKVWREMMDGYYPNSAWLCLRRDIFDRLHQYKMQHSIPTWDALFESVIPAEEAVGK